MSSDINPSDHPLIDATDDDDDIPISVPMDDYGYESDSDLDDIDDLDPVANPETPKDQSVVSPTSSPKASAEIQLKDGSE